MLLTKPNHRHGGADMPELIRFEHYEFLEDEDLLFMTRFYALAFRDRPKVYRVPKNMEEVAVSHKVMDSLATM